VCSEFPSKRYNDAVASSQVGKSALVGLTAGLLLAAAVLAGLSMKNESIDCKGLTTEECIFELETHGEVARVQAQFGLGLACLGGGLLLWLRLGRRRPDESR
jgi:hypothetical protein